VAKLVVISGTTDQQEFALADEAVIGRSRNCEVTVSGPSVSRRHARIIRNGAGYAVEDLGSANGTRVNGQPVQTLDLAHGDVIGIGHFKFAFQLDDEEAPAPRPAALQTGRPTVMAAVDLGGTLTDEALASPLAAARLRMHMEVLQEIAEASCGALEIDGLVRLILGQLLRVYPQADHAHALLLGLREGNEDLSLSAASPGDDGTGPGMSRTLLEIALAERRAVLAADVGENEELSVAASIVGHSLNSMMCCPLVVGSRALGAIQVDTASAGAPFNEDDLQLLVTIAGHASTAAENARLHGEMVAQQRLAAVGEAVSSVAHCIKNVLNGLKGGSYILDLGIKKQEPERISKGWEMVKRNTAFMSDLVRDMLAYCRKGGLRREPTDVGEMLNETVLMVRESAAQKGIEVSLDGPGKPVVVHLDAAGIKRAVLNLLTNAIEACPEGSRVTVSAGTEEMGSLLRISVRDDGPGIPPDVRERLFEAFFTTKGSSGTGLGLALVHKMAEEHGGRVELESEPGEGAAFHIIISTRREEEETSVE